MEKKKSKKKYWTGRTYYANMVTKTTQWEFPVNPQQQQPQQPQRMPQQQQQYQPQQQQWQQQQQATQQQQQWQQQQQATQQQWQGPQQIPFQPSDQEQQPTQDIQDPSNIPAASDSSKTKTSEELREDLAQILKKIKVNLDTNDNNFIINALSEIVKIFNNPETWKEFTKDEKIEICELGSQFSKEVDNTKNIQFFEAKKIALNKYSNACEIFDKIHPKLLRANNNKQPCLAFLYTHNLSLEKLNFFIEGIRALKISSLRARASKRPAWYTVRMQTSWSLSSTPLLASKRKDTSRWYCLPALFF